MTLAFLIGDLVRSERSYDTQNLGEIASPRGIRLAPVRPCNRSSSTRTPN